MTGAFEGRWLHIESTPTRLPGGDVLFDGITQDITERRRLEASVVHQAFHDTLTDLPNRRLLVDRLCHAHACVRRSKGHGAVLYLDLDNFKPLNDRHGHGAGDQLLRTVAERLLTCVRASDTVARIGGDEFVVLLCDLDGLQETAVSQAQLVADKVLDALSPKYVLSVSAEGGRLRVVEHICATSIGIAMFAGEDADLDGILRAADSAMYLAKWAGGNQSCLAKSSARSDAADEPVDARQLT